MTGIVLLVLNHYLLGLVDHVQKPLQVAIAGRVHPQDREPLVTIARTQAIYKLLQDRLDGQLALILYHIDLLFFEFALVLGHDVVEGPVDLSIDHFIANVFDDLVVDELSRCIG